MMPVSPSFPQALFHSYKCPSRSCKEGDGKSDSQKKNSDERFCISESDRVTICFGTRQPKAYPTLSSLLTPCYRIHHSRYDVVPILFYATPTTVHALIPTHDVEGHVKRIGHFISYGRVKPPPFQALQYLISDVRPNGVYDFILYCLAGITYFLYVQPALCHD